MTPTAGTAQLAEAEANVAAAERRYRRAGNQADSSAARTR